MITGPGGRRCDRRLSHQKIKLLGYQTSTLCLLNPKKRQVDQIEVDGCAITQGLRCDWLVRTTDLRLQEEIFVELKGSDIEYASKQIEASIPKLSSDPSRGQKRCLVALTRVPLAGTDLNRIRIRFKKLYHARFNPVRDGGSVPL